MKIAPFVMAGLILPTQAFAASPAPSARREVQVRCDKGETIGRALAKLDKLAPNTLNVSGTCQENVLISGFDDLQIVGQAGTTLVPVPSATAHAIDVAAARAVSIEGVTIRVTDGSLAMGLGACAACRLTNVTVDGGIAFYAYEWSSVTLSHFKSTGTGGWTSVGAWHAHLFIEDSVFEDTNAGGPTATRWCGLAVGQGSMVNIARSTVRGFGMGIGVDSNATVNVQDTTVEDNWCNGVWAATGAHLAITSNSRVVNNSAVCWNGGVNLDSGATLQLAQGLQPTGRVEVTGNTGGGIKLNHHAFAEVGGATLVSANIGPGLEVRNVSMALAAQEQQQPNRKAEISGNQGPDLRCDSISHINNRALITEAASEQCTNLWTGDGPP